MQAIKNVFRQLCGKEPCRSTGEKTLFWGINLTALLLWGLGLGVVSLWFASAAIEHGLALFLSYFHMPKLLLLNLAPALLITLLFWLLFNRTWAAMAGSGLVIIGASLVNFYKITLRNDPFLAADVFLVSEAANMTGEYTLTFPLAVILTIAFCIAAVFAASKLLRAKIRKLPLRAGLLILTAILCAFGIKNIYFNKELYAACENIDRNAWFLSRWSDRDQYVSRGFVYPFLYSAQSAVEQPPEGYDAEAAAAYMARFESADIPEDKKVNVIAIMLEAYNDFSRYDDLTFDADPYAYFHKLQQESISGQLITSIFAGGTIDTERSFVTGYPYMSEYRSPLPTYVSWLQDQGYYTEGGHPGFDWFYNRRNVAEYFGFDNYYFYEDRYEVSGDGLMMDTPFFDDLLGLYSTHRAQSDDPYFSFSVTYQNHGPYADNILYDGQTQYVKNTGYSEEAWRILNNYFWGIGKTDEAMEQLIESLRQTDEPTVVVLFGDHNPWLGDNSYVYNEIGMSLDRGTEEGFYNYYATPYVIWANDAAKAATGNDFTGDGGSFGPHLLMNKLFEACGWAGPAWMQASDAMAEEIDVMNRSGILRLTETGQLTTADALPADLAEAYRQYKCAEYYMKKDAQ